MNEVQDFNPDAGFVQLDLPTFRMNRYEVTQEAFRQFDAHSELSGVSGHYHVPQLSMGRSRLPMGMVDAFEAEKYCRFMGMRLPSRFESRKAGRGGLWLDRDRTIRNKDPTRLTPWGTLDHSKANVATTAAVHLAVVGAFPGDRSPYGIFDLAGNMREWGSGNEEGLQPAIGASWADQEPEVLAAELFRLDHPSSGSAVGRRADFGLRCVSE
jgi:formylglycine-generating enzyme required for sulfatase activity